MPLSPPVEREPIHTRKVTCRGYLRQDGLWDVEGHMTDQKSYAYPNDYRGQIEAGEPVHAVTSPRTFSAWSVFRSARGSAAR